MRVRHHGQDTALFGPHFNAAQAAGLSTLKYLSICVCVISRSVIQDVPSAEVIKPQGMSTSPWHCPFRPPGTRPHCPPRASLQDHWSSVVPRWRPQP